MSDTSLESCLAGLESAIVAASSLGLDVSDAQGVLGEARERLGLSPDVYVLGLVGGTGVGKSSLVNALAGRPVVEVGVRRPTTDHPVAWLPAASAAIAGPILDRLGIVDRRLDEDGRLGPVVLLDLPDVDSVAPEHRATVEALLPCLDAVAWVADPEKYADAILHDRFLRSWLPRLDRQVLVLNKADRLEPGQLRDIRRDLHRVLAADGSGEAALEVLATSTLDPADAVSSLGAWLRSEADAKRVVAGRIARGSSAAADALVAQAGAAPGHDLVPLLSPGRRANAVATATAETLRLVDLGGAERRAVAATRARARRVGTGPAGWLTSLLYRASGRERSVADPGGYLRRWRERGSTLRAIAPIGEATAEAIAAAPPALRPRLAAGSDPDRRGAALGAAVDGALATIGELTPPASLAWRVAGLLQTLTTALIVFAAAWLVIWVVLRPPVGTVEVPVIGAVAQPLALLAVGLVAGFAVARALAMHAGFVGRRWARGVAEVVRASIGQAVAGEAFASLDAVEEGRAALRAGAERAGACAGTRSTDTHRMKEPLP